jgi:hypothetical protein
MFKREDYIDFMKRDVEDVKGVDFTGNVEFFINVENGQIKNINCYKHTSDVIDYMDLITEGLKSAEEMKYTGQIGFKINIKEGEILRTNCTKSRSIKI